MSQTILVTGFTGYIALHIVHKALEKGYNVIGTVRSQKKGDEYAAIVNDPKFSYEVVEEIGVDGAFDDVFKKHPEITLVIHSASPVIFDPKDPEKDVMVPAIKGTTGIMKTITKYGPHVKRVVTTSSYSAHNAPFDHYGKKGRVVTEDAVSAISYEQALADPSITYWGSKKFSELAAWEFVKTETPAFSLTTVSPTWCFGPQAYDALVSEVYPSVSELVTGLLKLKPDAKVESSPAVSIDVRDIAEAHIRALEIPEAAGQRLILFDKKTDEQYMLNVINERFPELKGKIPNPPPRDYNDIECPTVDCSKTLSILGLKLTPVEDAVVDQVAQYKKFVGFPTA